MAVTFDSQRLRIQRQAEQQLDRDHTALARNIATLVLLAATGRNDAGDPVLPLSRVGRDRLKTAIWEQVLKPYYVGSGTDPLRGATPQSPYARLLVEAITQTTRVQVARQVAVVQRLLANRAPDVLQWLTGPRPLSPVRELRGVYDPYHQWVDPNGYRLGDRIWRTSIDVRARVDRLLDYHIARGTSAVQIADLLEPYLTRQALQRRTLTPYGTEGSYAARRLARTEITAAAGRATINSSIANPFVNGVQWRLSARHPKIDICDDYARGGQNGDGIYAPDQVPPYPPHPHCLCALLPVVTQDVNALIGSLRQDIQAARSNLFASVGARRARSLQGILNAEFLTQAILGGYLGEALAQLEEEREAA